MEYNRIIKGNYIMSPNKPLLYKLTIIISMVGCIMSNDNISKDLWKNLNPLSRNYEDGLELLPE